MICVMTHTLPAVCSDCGATNVARFNTRSIPTPALFNYAAEIARPAVIRRFRPERLILSNKLVYRHGHTSATRG